MSFGYATYQTKTKYKLAFADPRSFSLNFNVETESARPDSPIESIEITKVALLDEPDNLNYEIRIKMSGMNPQNQPIYSVSFNRNVSQDSDVFKYVQLEIFGDGLNELMKNFVTLLTNSSFPNDGRRLNGFANNINILSDAALGEMFVPGNNLTREGQCMISLSLMHKLKDQIDDLALEEQAVPTSSNTGSNRK